MSRIRPLTWVAVLTLLIPASLEAQSHALDRGSVLASGSAHLTSRDGSGSEGRRTTYAVNPSVQYFVSPGLALGGSLSLSGTGGDGAHTFVGAGPAASYYFGGAEQRAHPYVGGSVFWGRSTWESPLGEQEYSQTSYRGAAGLMYLLAPGAGLNAEAFYSAWDGNADASEFGLALGLSLFIF